MYLKRNISVVIVNFNAGPYLVDSVRTVIDDAHEVLIIDNASTDGSLELLELSFVGYSKLSVIRNLTNEGFAKACNRGATLATGNFIFFLNPDCELVKGAMIKLLEAIEIDPEVAMVGGLLLNPDGTEQAGARRAIPTPWRSFVRAFGLDRFKDRWPKLFSGFYLHLEPLPKNPIEVEAISGACMLVRGAAIQKVGLFDNGYFIHCEDLDWCMRFRRSGWKIIFVPSARLIHHKGVCSRSRLIFLEWHKHKGMFRFYRKHFLHQYPGILIWFVFLGIYLRFLLLLSFYSMRKLRQMLRFD